VAVRGLLALVVLVWSTSALAQGGAATARPDLSGYWELRFDSFNVPRAPLTTPA